MALMSYPGDNREDKSKRFKRFGIYRAEVLRTDDSQFRGRIQVRVLHLHPTAIQPTADTTSTRPKESILAKVTTTGATPRSGVPPAACPWAEPCYPFGGKKGGNSGFIMTPYVGSTVWVMFEHGYSGKVVWMGCWLGSNDIPDEIANPAAMANIRLIRTEFGHLILMDDTPGTERMFLGVAPATGARVRFLEFDEANAEVRLHNDLGGTGTKIFMSDGEILLSAGGTTSLSIKKTGEVTILTAGPITLGTGPTQGVCLDSLIAVITTAYAVYDAHTHTITGGSSAGTTSIPSALQIAPTIGVNSSASVKAKL